MFTSARLKLTGWYLLIIMLVSIFFSGLIFRILTLEFDRISHFQKIRIEKRIDEKVPQEFRKNFPPPPQFFDEDVISESKTRLFWILFCINGIILFFSGILGYILAGITLRPIKIMIDEQNRFITDASHELRTPLTALKLSMEVFLRDKETDLSDAKKLILSNIKKVDELNSLSEGLLQLSSYQYGKNNVSFEKNSLHEMIEDALQKIDLQARKKKIKIVYKKINQNILVSKNDFVNLLVIILENAVKYSSEDKEIKIYSKKSSHGLDLHIEDQGIGIEKQDLPHIFDRFYRADNSRSKNLSSGYGLGLSIAKKITERNNIKLIVSSTSGKGSDFVIRI